MVNIIIEGNIGNGKSTLIELLKKNFKSFEFTYIPESVDLWQNYNGINILNLYYKDKKWSYVFQLLTLYSILSNYKSNRKNLFNIFERSIYGWKVFIDANTFLTKEQRLALNIIYTFLVNINYMQIDFIVHLTCKPIVSYYRITKRNRIEEKSVSYKYIEALSELHNKMFTNNSLPIMIFHLNVDSNKALINFVRNIPYNVIKKFQVQSNTI